MTEAEWLGATIPDPMLSRLQDRVPSRRFWWFTAAACARAGAFLPFQLLQVATRVSEQLAAAEAGPEERRSALAITGLWKQRFVEALDFAGAVAILDFEKCVNSPGPMAFACARWASWLALLRARWGGQSDEPREELGGSEHAAAICAHRHCLADALRCIFGNPFRPVPSVEPAWLAWKDGTVPQLARGAHENRHLPEGTLDLVRLQFLADALEDAGCSDVEILGHLRGPGPHVRGCWVMDLLLRKA